MRREIWKDLAVSRQGAKDLLNPLIEAWFGKKSWDKKTSRYISEQVGGLGLKRKPFACWPRPTITGAHQVRQGQPPLLLAERR